MRTTTMKPLFMAWTVLCAFLPMGHKVLGAPFAEWFDRRSPQGAAIRIWGEGDEFSAIFEAQDGHAVVFDAALRAYVYARQDVATLALVPTGIAVGDESDADRQALAKIPLHLRDGSSAAKAERMRLIEEDERVFGIRKRWSELKVRTRQNRTRLRGGTNGARLPLMAQPSAPTVGKTVGLTLLVDFPVTNGQGQVVGTLSEQTNPDVTKERLDELINGENCSLWGNASSVRKYFEEASCGRLCYTNVVIGWIMAQHPRDYYDDPNKQGETCAQTLIGEILATLSARPDYESRCLPLLRQVSHSNGLFLSLNVFFAGLATTGPWNKGLWAHKGGLQAEQYTKLVVDVGSESVHFHKYMITPLTESPSIDTFCHESGHLICGFPDLYSYDRDEKGATIGGNGVGAFCLMHSSTSRKNPQHLCAYLRVAAGWVTPRSMPPGDSLLTVSNRLDDVWKYENPDDETQYFLVENRQRIGRDAELPGGGILIWRCDENGSNTHSSELLGVGPRRSYEVSLEQADGLYELELQKNLGQLTDLWCRENVRLGQSSVFADDTTPCARWKDGSCSGLCLSGFSRRGEAMTFNVGKRHVQDYEIGYVLCGGTPGRSQPTFAEHGTSFCVSAPARGDAQFLGWSVVGVSDPTARWGESSSPTSTFSGIGVKCANGSSGDVHFLNLTEIEGGSVTLVANWKPNSYPSVGGDWHVSAEWGSDANDGTSWGAAFATVQKAVDAASSDKRRVVVADGVYDPFAITKKINLDIVSVNGAERTIVDGSQQWSRGVSNACAKFVGQYQTLTGFTLQNGRAERGGGTYSGTQSNCVYRYNAASGGGGGAYIGVQSGCKFFDNRSQWGGGTEFGEQYGCWYEGNFASFAGGASYGGNLYNCVMYDNLARHGGGSFTGQLWSCTLHANSAITHGGGAFSGRLRNCIVYGNYGPGPEVCDAECSTTCSSVELQGAGNIVANPIFVDAQAGNLRLRSDSPCIDAGDDGDAFWSTDIDGHPRVNGACVDMGAYEADRPDLLPYTPTDKGWSGPLVVSTTSTLRTDSTQFTVADKVYIAWASVCRNGSAAPFKVALEIDGVSQLVWATKGWREGAYGHVDSYLIGKLPAGTHEIKIVIDSEDDIDESDEDNNVMSKTIVVAPEGFVIDDGTLVKYTGAGGDVAVPDGVTSIGEGAFQSCELSTVVVPQDVTSIGANAFARCRRLTAVTLPSGVKSVGEGAFDGCTSLETIRVSGSGGMGDIRRLLSESGLDVDGVTFVRCEVEQQTSVSDAGWHEVSFSVLPEGGKPEDVFASVADKIGYVTSGSKNWNPLTGGTLTALEIGRGYWVQTTADKVTWTVTGQPNPDVEIALKAGWNLIGYPLLEEGEIETVLATALATGNIRYIYSGSRVYPGTLTTMTPGKGYWVYAEAAGTIRFDAK